LPVFLTIAKQEEMIVSWNGILLSEDEVRVSPFDGGVLRGEGVFETMRADSGRIIHWSKHYRRLLASSERFGFNVPESSMLQDEIEEVLRANQLEEKTARVRLTHLGKILITAVELLEQESPFRVGLSSYPINERGALMGMKVCSYAENMIILKESQMNEMIRPNLQGNLCEGCVSNVFYVMGDEIRTPSLENGCLPGISRERLLEKMPSIVEGTWPIDTIKEAREVWLSNATHLLTWVNELDGRNLGQPSRLFLSLLDHLRTVR